MKNIILLIVIVFFSCEVQATSIAVPTLGEMVRNADTIVKGSISVNGNSVVFHVESNVKGKYRPNQTVSITANRTDMFFDFIHYAIQIQGQTCYILGIDRDDAISLPWNCFSVWPQGISQKWPIFGDADTCEKFIDALVEYEHLESNQSAQLNCLLKALRTEVSRPAALAYLNSNTSLFSNDRSLERDVLSVVASTISSQRIYDEWTVSCMRSLSPSMPQSITIPYFMEAAKNGGKQGELAQTTVEAALRVRHLIDCDIGDQKTLTEKVTTVLPSLRAADARKNEHLFDLTNRDIAMSAGLVFSEIFGEPRPNHISASEEKAFWLSKISKQQK